MNFKPNLLLLFFSLAALVQSCVVSQYRVIETKWSQSGQEYAISENVDSRLVADFWCWNEQGRLKIALENNSDTTLLIDLYQSALFGDSASFVYSSDTVEFPVYYTYNVQIESANWSATPLVSETCDRYIALQPKESVVLSKFYIHEALAPALDTMYYYGESRLYGPFDSPAKGGHRLAYTVGGNDSTHYLDHTFYVNARRKWIYKNPNRVYLPETRAHNYYIRSTAFHPVGTFVMLALISFSIHLGTRN